MTLVRSGVLLTLAVGLANLLNAAFQFSLARILEPDEYALLAALFAIVIVAAIPPLAFQATAAREVSVRLEHGDERGAGMFLRGMARSVVFWGTVLALGGIAVAVVVTLAGMDDPLAAGATVITIAAALGIPVVWGGLQGSGRFYSLSGAHVLFAGARLAAGLAIALAGGSVGAVMVGVAGATMLTLLLTALPIRSLFEAGRGAARQALATRANAGAALGLTALWALMYSDLLVARLAFDGDEAGAYAAAAVASKVLLLVPIAATTVLFPRVAVLHDRARERQYLLKGYRCRGRSVGARHRLRLAPRGAADRPPVRLRVRGGRRLARPALPRDVALRTRDRLPLPLPRAGPVSDRRRARGAVRRADRGVRALPRRAGPT